MYCSLIPRLSPSFLLFAVRLSRRGPGIYSHVTSRTGQIMQMWVSCTPQTISPTGTHWSATNQSRKTAAHKGDFLSLFVSQDCKDIHKFHE